MVTRLNADENSVFQAPQVAGELALPGSGSLVCRGMGSGGDRVLETLAD